MKALSVILFLFSTSVLAETICTVKTMKKNKIISEKELIRRDGSTLVSYNTPLVTKKNLVVYLNLVMTDDLILSGNITKKTTLKQRPKKNKNKVLGVMVTGESSSLRRQGDGLFDIKELQDAIISEEHLNYKKETLFKDFEVKVNQEVEFKFDVYIAKISCIEKIDESKNKVVDSDRLIEKLDAATKQSEQEEKGSQVSDQ